MLKDRIANNMIEIREIINSLQEPCVIRGQPDGQVIRDFMAIDKANCLSLSFCRYCDNQALAMIKSSQARVIVCSSDLQISDDDLQDKILIQVSNPRLTFSRILAKYFSHKAAPGIHSSAIIHKQARLGKRVYIGPQCYIGDCEIGDDTYIEGQAYINDKSSIGKSVIIHPGVTINTPAVSFIRNEKKELEWFPQLGRVIIEDNVEIGAQTVIAQGPLPLNDTVIGEGTKIDIHVEVGHGVRVGKHCIIVGHSILCGRVKVGDYTQISGQVCIREGITVGSRSLVGMGSVVVNDIPDSVVVIGSPAKVIRENIL